MDSLELARRLQEMRVMSGYTQQQLAQATGVSLTYIKQVESGKANPTIQILDKWAKTLGYEMDLVFSRPKPLTP